MAISQCFFFISMLIFQLHFGFLMFDRLAIAIGHCCALLSHHPLLLLGQVLAQCFQLEMKHLKDKWFEWITWWMDCCSNVIFACFPFTERKLWSSASTPGRASCRSRSSGCSPFPLVMNLAEFCAAKCAMLVLLLAAAVEDWRGEEAVVLKMQKFL